MKKKFISIIIIILVLTLILAGCSKSNKNELINSLEKTDRINSQESLIQWEIDFKPSSLEGKLGGLILDQLRRGSYTEIRSKEDIKNQKFLSLVSKSFMGLNLESEIIRQKEILALRSPTLKKLPIIGDKYLLVKGEEMDEAGEDILRLSIFDYLGLYKDLNQALEKTLRSGLREENIQVIEKIKIETEEESLEGREFRVHIGNDEIKPMVKSFIVNILKNKNLRNIILGWLRENQDLVKDIISDPDQLKENKETLDRIFEAIDLEGRIELIYEVDQDSYVRAGRSDYSLVVIRKNTGEEESISLKVDTSRWNINKDLNLDIPEFTEENSINIMDFRKYWP